MSQDQFAETEGFDQRMGKSPAGRYLPAVGPYRAVEFLGEGAMGVVYLAEQATPIRRQVALKILKAEASSKELVSRFEREQQALAVMDHPNVARVYDAGQTDDGRPYFVMEYVAGIPITRFCDKHKFPTARRLDLFTTVCEAVQHAHDHGVIHRDIKPSNILVAGTADRAVPKVIDFGIAKAIGQKLSDDTFTTQPGQLVGTPAYMSPEQAQLSAKGVDNRTDVYSLGVVMYELLVGVLPFDFSLLKRGTLAEVQRMIVEEDPVFPSTRLIGLGVDSALIAGNRGTDPTRLRRELRGDLDWITMKALEKDRTRRYATVADLARDVERYRRSQPISAGPPTLRYRAVKFIRRRRRAIAVAGLGSAVILSAAFGGLSLQRARRESVTREFSEIRLLEHRAPDEAIARLTRLVEGAPDFLDARIDLAYLLARESRVSQSVEVAREILADAPETGPAHLLLAQQYRHRRPEEAEQHFREARRLLPQDRYHTALAMPQERATEAVALLNQVLQEDGTNFDAHWNLAWRYFQLGDHAGMLDEAIWLTASRPKANTAWNVRGIALSRLEQLDEAIDAFSRAVELQPDHAATYLNRGDSYSNLKQYELALADCNRAIELEPGLANAYAQRAGVHLAQDRLDAAIADCDEALRRHPGNALAFYYRAKIAQRKKDGAGVLANLARAIEREPANPTFLWARAGLLSELRQYEGALADYSTYLRRWPAHADAYLRRGHVLLTLGRVDEARADFDEALRRDSSKPEFFHGRARVFRLMGIYEAAMVDHDQAVTLAPEAPEPRLGRGITRWLAGDLSGAVADLEGYLGLEKTPPVFPAIWLWQIHAARGDPAEAEAALERADQSARDWQAELIRMIRHRAPADEILGSAGDDGKRCEAMYYLGARAQVQGLLEEARDWYAKCVAVGIRDYQETDLARGHLAAMGSPKAPSPADHSGS